MDKKQRFWALAIFALACLTVTLFVPMKTSSAVFTLASTAAVVAAVPGKKDEEEDIVFEKAADGKLLIPPEQFQKAMDRAADAAVKSLVETLGLNKPRLLPGTGGDGVEADSQKKFEPREGESKALRIKRINEAAIAIRGGHLAIENAPKEVKTMRYFRDMANKDMAEAKILGEMSWPEEERRKALSEGSAADGGNLVPIEFATDLLVAIEEYQSVADCTQHAMTTNELDLRSVTTKPTVYQVDEAVAVTESGSKFGKPILTAKAFAGLQIMSKELFQDNNVGLYDKLLVLFAEQFAKRKSTEIFTGQTFTGIFGASGVQETVMASASIPDVRFKEIVNFLNSLSPGQLMKGGKVYMHRIIWGYLQGIEDANGRPIVMQPWDERNRSLLGKPVVLDEAMPAIDAANTSFMAYGNLAWVDHGVRQDISAQVLTEGTVAGVNLAEKRSIGLIIDTRWGINVSLAANLARLKTKA